MPPKDFRELMAEFESTLRDFSALRLGLPLLVKHHVGKLAGRYKIRGRRKLQLLTHALFILSFDCYFLAHATYDDIPEPLPIDLFMVY